MVGFSFIYKINPLSISKQYKNLNSAPDPIKDAYKLKSQIDAVQKSQQSFKTSEIIQIQTKLLTKAWKWISKYGIGSLNQYTKMKKQIQNYDLLINKISAMQNNMETNFNALHRVTKQHSLSLNDIKSNIYTNCSYLQQFKSNINKQFKQTHHDKQHILSLLTKQKNGNNEKNGSIENEHNGNNDNNDNGEDDDDVDNDDEQLDDIQFPLTIDTMNHINDDNDQMVLLSEQLSPQIVSDNIIHSGYNDVDDDDKEDQFDSDNEGVIDSLNVLPITRSLDNVDTMSVQTIDASSYKLEQSISSKHRGSLLLTDQLKPDRDRQESVIKLNENSMMKINNNKLQKLQKSKSDERYNKEDIDDFSCTDKENMIVDEIMENLTKLEGLSNDFKRFMEKESDKHKLETQQIIKSKLKPLHEILDQRELGLLSELKYLHKEKTVKMKQGQHVIQQNKNFLKMKLVECQKILQQYQTKWDTQYKILKNQFAKSNDINHSNGNHNGSPKFDFNNLFKDNQFEKKVTNLKMTLIKERKQQLTLINNQVNEQITVKLLQRDIANIKQMYIFTVNSANLHSLKDVKSVFFVFLGILFGE